MRADIRRPPTVIICPGNGCSNIRQSNWYGMLYAELTRRDIPCVCKDFPDPLHARRDRWIPFIRSMVEKHATNDSVVLVGHSSGAQATLRYTEQYPAVGSVLVAATYSDLGDPHERASGYYPQPTSDGKEETNPYLFDAMKTNCPKWYQFHSDDDPFIPLREAELIRDGLGLTDTYHMLPGRSHFFEFDPLILESIITLCNSDSDK